MSKVYYVELGFEFVDLGDCIYIGNLRDMHDLYGYKVCYDAFELVKTVNEYRGFIS